MQPRFTMSRLICGSAWYLLLYFLFVASVHGWIVRYDNGNVSTKTVVVQPGDTLRRLAAEHLGDADRWQEFLQFNRFSDIDALYPGERLYAPVTQRSVSPTTPQDPVVGPGISLQTPNSIEWITKQTLLLTDDVHYLVIRVEDAVGVPVPNVPVEWLLNTRPGVVGTILDADDSTARQPVSPMSRFHSRGKRANRYAVTYTNDYPESIQLVAGRLTVGIGETWIAIQANCPGVTDVTAFCPAIPSSMRSIEPRTFRWEQTGSSTSREMAVVDIAHHESLSSDMVYQRQYLMWEFPEDSQSLLSLKSETRNVVPIQVRTCQKADGAPIAGLVVRYTLLPGGPHATLGELSSESMVASVDALATTDDMGIAETYLVLHDHTGGTSEVRIYIEGAGSVTEHVYRHQWIRGDLQCRQEGPSALGLKGHARYTLFVDNHGQAAISGIQIKQTIPTPAVNFLKASDSGRWDFQDGSITWIVGSLEAGERIIRTTELEAAEIGVWPVQLSVTSEDGLEAETRVMLQVTSAELEISIDGPTTASVDQDIDYNVNIRNTGEQPATSMLLEVELPLDGVSLLPSTTGAAREGNRLTWEIDRLIPGRLSHRQFQVRITEPGAWQLQANVSSGETHPASTQILIHVPTTALELIAQPSTTIIGRKLLIRLTVRNDGPTPITNHVTTLELPASLRILRLDEDGHVTPQGSIQWSIPSVVPRSEKRFSVIAQAEVLGKFAIHADLSDSGDRVASTQAAIAILSDSSDDSP